jgi:disulfide bond formation protein DsbB
MGPRPLRPRTVSLLLIAAAAAPLLAALISQFVGGLQPCELCLLQRLPYDAALVLGLASLAFAGRPGPLRLAAALAGIAFLASAAIAVFHVGVEQHWWVWESACTGTVSSQGKTPEEVIKELMGKQVQRCDEIQWSLFGLSLAGFNAIYGTLAGLAALWIAAAAPWRRGAAAAA